MDETPAAVACDRIEAALARIEAALTVAIAPDRDLRRRHELLREATASSLLTIDALIDAHEIVNADAKAADRA